MRKPIKNAKKKPTLKAIEFFVEDACESLQKMIDKDELGIYIKGYDIRGEMVDESDEITPEQVAILGAYTQAKIIHDFVKGVYEEEKKEELKSGIYKTENGKAIEINSTDLPDELKDILRKIIGE